MVANVYDKLCLRAGTFSCCIRCCRGKFHRFVCQRCVDLIENMTCHVCFFLLCMIVAFVWHSTLII